LGALPWLLVPLSGCAIVGGIDHDYETCASTQTWCPVTGCVDVASDAANCGACGHACSGGETCHAGACACAPSATACGGTCAVLTTDAMNCGACGHACAGGATCIAGACCATACGGTCRDFATDPDNCGACGHACTSGYCNASACEACPAGKTACSGVCVDLTTDDANCGSCGRSCGSATPCATGGCTGIVVPTNDAVGAIVIHGETLYWAGDASSGGSKIGMVALTTGTVTPLVLSSKPLPGIATDGVGNAYWIETSGQHAVKSVDGTGKVTTFVTPMPSIGALAASPTDVFMGGIKDDVYDAKVATPMAAPSIFAPAGNIGMAAFQLLVDTSSVYVVSSNFGAIFALPLGGGGPRTLIQGADPGQMAIDATYGYYADASSSNASTVRRVPLAGGAATTLVTRSNRQLGYIAVDASGIYWTENTDATHQNPPFNGTLMKAALDGSGVITLTTGLNYPAGVAVDAKDVYFVDSATLEHVPK
jgi:hypothetical protein